MVCIVSYSGSQNWLKIFCFYSYEFLKPVIIFFEFVAWFETNFNTSGFILTGFETVLTPWLYNYYNNYAKHLIVFKKKKKTIR